MKEEIVKEQKLSKLAKVLTKDIVRKKNYKLKLQRVARQKKCKN